MHHRRVKNQLRSVLTKRPNFSQELFERLWAQNLTVQELADFFKVADETIRIAANKLQLKKKRELNRDLAMEWQPGDPTPEEIAERAAEIRKKWSEKETLLRMGFSHTALNAEWTPPSYGFNGRTSSFHFIV